MNKLTVFALIPVVVLVLLVSFGIIQLNFSPEITTAQAPPNPPPAQGGPSGWIDDGVTVRLTTSTDNIGIGTVSPTEKLDVIGNISLNGLIDGIDLSIKALDWDISFNERRQWDGSSTSLDPVTGRTSLGLGSLSILNSVSGGIGGSITDKTVVTEDLGILNHAIFKDTDGPNCHKITFNSIGTLDAAPVSCSTGEPPSSVWASKADMPTGRYRLATAVVNNRIYALDGFINSGNIHGTNKVEEYDPSSNTWSTKTPLPAVHWGIGASAVSGKIYAVGGATGSGPEDGVFASTDEYSPITDAWTSKAPMPTARALLTTAVLNNKIYAISGRSSNQNFSISYVNSNEEYDPVTNAWNMRAQIPTARDSAAAAAANGKIYVFGGGFLNAPFNTVEEYNPSTDTWATKAPMPTARFGLAAVTIGQYIYVMGGAQGNFIEMDVVERYDPIANSWTTEIPMPTARWGLGAAEVNGKIYAIGGLVNNTIDSTANEEFTPGP